MNFPFVWHFILNLRCLILIKTYVLNIRNLNTAEDAAKINDYFMDQPGVEKVDIEMDLSIVSIHYNESVIGSLNKILEAFDRLGYLVR